MTAEVKPAAPEDDEDECDFIECEPVGIQLGDGDIFVHDMDEFTRLTGAVATQNKAGQLYILTEALVWVSVEELNKKPKGGTLRSVKKTTET